MRKFWNGRLLGIPETILLLTSVIIEKIINKVRTFLFIKNFKKSGKNNFISKGFEYRFPGSIEFGNNIVIGKNTEFISEGLEEHYLILHDGVSIGSKCRIDFTGGLEIKKGAHIAHNVLVSTHEHGYDYRNKPVGKPLLIEQDAFIGSNSLILHNVNRIGKNAVIGTGAVVTKDVPDGAIVAGNPAKILKYV